MGIQFVEEQHNNHRQIWKNLKDLLKSCFGFRRNNRLFNHNGSLIDSNRLRENICDKDQSYKQRQKTWPYLLNIYSPSMTNSDKEIYQNRAQIRYKTLKLRWQERVSCGDSYYVTLADMILKDVRRTDRHILFLKKKKEILFNILMTYSVYHPSPGYSQGMSDMLTPIVYVFIDESLSYVAFCSLMNRYMNSLFDRDQIEINRRLHLFHFIFRSIDFELWNKINFNGEDYFFVYRWLLLDCKREFNKLNHILRVLEHVWIYSMPSSYSSQSPINDRALFPIFISISILQEDRQKLFSCSNEEDLHKYFYSSSPSRSDRSTKHILQRAQISYSNYISLHK